MPTTRSTKDWLFCVGFCAAIGAVAGALLLAVLVRIVGEGGEGRLLVGAAIVFGGCSLAGAFHGHAAFRESP